MDKEVKRKWVEALRSGKYTQGQGTLRTASNKFCCLGVLCDVVDAVHWESEVSGVWRHGEMCSMPSTDVLKSAGIDPWDDEHTEILANMNDEHNKSFTEIADYIDEKM